MSERETPSPEPLVNAMLGTKQSDDQKEAARRRVEDARQVVTNGLAEVEAFAARLKESLNAAEWERGQWDRIRAVNSAFRELQIAEYERDGIKYQRRLKGVFGPRRGDISDIVDETTGEALGVQHKNCAEWSRHLRLGHVISFTAELLVFPEQRRWDLLNFSNVARSKEAA